MNKKQNPLQIRVGDTVEINFPHMPSDPAFLADVTEVVDRTTMGQDAGISYRRLDGKTNEPVTPDGCSVSYVTRVVTRAPYIVKKISPVNVFAEHLAIDRARICERGHGWVGYDRIGGIYLGSPVRLAMIALATSGDRLDRTFDDRKFQQLWTKAKFIGQVNNPDPVNYPDEHYTSVRWKVFQRWVIRNRHRFLSTIKEMEQSGRDYNNAMRYDYDHEDVAA